MEIENSRPYYLTRPASRLLEFIGMCIEKKEPVLIVGETGVGKTSAIQYLANCTNHQLVAVNLNQQTESCDLIGGIKPVNIEHYLVPVYEEFKKAFSERPQKVNFVRKNSHVRTSLGTSNHGPF